MIKLTPATQSEVTEHVPGPLASPLYAVKGLGITDLDKALEEIHVRAISRLAPPSPPVRAGDGWVNSSADDACYYRVTFDPAFSIDAALEHLRAIGGTVAAAEPTHWRESMAARAVSTPRAEPGFFHPSYHPDQWGIPQIDCPSAWRRTRGDSDIVVAVVDSGVDLNHRDLRPHLLQGVDVVDLPNPTLEDGLLLEGTFTGNRGQPWDEVGHGTHVAGTISCERTCTAGVVGVTWACSILPVRVLARLDDRNAKKVRGWGTGLNIATGIRWAVEHGAHIINLSLGDISPDEYERLAIEYAVANNVVVVAAAGNYNKTWPMYPAAFPDVIAVGATDSADQRPDFSGHGNHVKIYAPGDKIRSTYWGNGMYASMSGTSMAAPHVTGVAALLLSLSTSLTASDVRRIIEDTATPAGAPPAGLRRVNAEAALQCAR
ncbi:S8 family serine peptidase [Streptomyces lunaelactis]|uniref:S8 family serine peptidase n=1 Tax=Streptomyces lunaelactis TaxID=1535768 RepID=UPI001585910F|nr:S8 family serine peptidase [Streptomyces lunaelactis]NUK23085.1 S8 family serine peptidase [Streptomyces lunaelactis]